MDEIHYQGISIMIYLHGLLHIALFQIEAHDFDDRRAQSDQLSSLSKDDALQAKRGGHLGWLPMLFPRIQFAGYIAVLIYVLEVLLRVVVFTITKIW